MRCRHEDIASGACLEQIQEKRKPVLRPELLEKQRLRGSADFGGKLIRSGRAPASVAAAAVPPGAGQDRDRRT